MGAEEGSGTRSSLLWEVKRLLEECENLPQVLLMENVPQVRIEKNRGNFTKWLKFLESKGYKSFVKDLNARNYGVAQSRTRTIVVSFLGEGWFKFPKPFKLKKKISDYLETEVAERYYIAPSTSRMYFDTVILNGRMPKDCSQVTAIDKVKIRQATKCGYTPCKIHGVVDLNFPTSTSRRGRVINGGDISPTLTTHNLLHVVESGEWEDDDFRYQIRLRFMTAREYWRLMGFSDEDFEKAQAVNSNKQLYKQAGNSIVKDVLCEVFRQLIEKEEEA